ncbi:MAG: flavodoxin domain-containing protein, partial [Nakamurella sp.]
MKNVVIVYESSYGNTHVVAEAIADGLRPAHHVDVMAVSHVDPILVGRAELIVVGGPTHVHGMSSPRTRAGAVDAASHSDGKLQLDADAAGPGLREWFD